MLAIIDAGGHVAIPEVVRSALGLSSGSTVDVVVQDGVIVLVPTAAGMRLVKREGGAVAETEQPLPVLTAAEVRRVLETGRR